MLLLASLVAAMSVLAGGRKGDDPPGSSHFGVWFTDRWGLPAYRYTGHPAASSLPTGHAPLVPTVAHQVGNDRIVGVGLTNGELSVRQDEGGPKLLHMSSEADSQYRGGFGYLSTTEGDVLAASRAKSTVSPGDTPGFELEFGVGYIRKGMANTSAGVTVSHVVFAPFGDDPVVVSEVTITDQRGAGPARPLQWDEVWGQARSTWRLDAVSTSFEHRITANPGADGGSTVLVDAVINTATECSTSAATDGPHRPSYEDCHPAPTFLASVDSFTTTFTTTFTTAAAAYFGSGGVVAPSGLHRPLDMQTNTTASDATMVMRRHFVLAAGGSVTLRFVAGYAPGSESPVAMAARIAATAPTLWSASSAEWRSFCTGYGATAPGLDARTVQRELQWHAYNLRAGLSFDSFRGEHVLNQGGNYAYSGGLQGAARDPVSHVMPLITAGPNGSKFVKEVVRYTLQELENDPRTGIAGWIPWGQGAFGMEDSLGFWPSDLENYLLLTAAQYVLATRDVSFLSEPVAPTNSTVPGGTVAELLWACFTHIRDSTGVSPTTGLITLLNVDHNDGLLSHLKPPNKTEAQLHGSSVMNTALAVYAYMQYVDVLRAVGETEHADAVANHTAQLQAAVEAAWAPNPTSNSSGWYKRVHLGDVDNGGWVGDERDGVMWTETQAWSLLADTAPDRIAKLVAELDRQVRKPSPVGAFNTGKSSGAGDYAGVWWCGNLALIAGLGRHGFCDLAVDEFNKNLLAQHAIVYPDIWFGVWSGPDTFNSVLMAADPEWKGKAES